MQKNIKETVEYVCQVLVKFGVDFIEPSHFRMAKHDQNDAINIFFKLLKKLLILDIYDFRVTDSVAEVEDEIVIALLKLRNCPLVLSTQNTDSIVISSSRDLLLICGQIMAEQNIFQLYSEKIILQIDQEIKQMNEKLQKQNQDDETKKNENKHNYQLSEDQAIQDMIVLYNIVNQKTKKLKQLRDREAKVYDKIMSMLSQVNPSKLSLYTLLNFSNNQVISEITAILKDLNNFVVEQSQQLKHQEIFWVWMESIVEEDTRPYKNHSLYGYQDQSIVISSNSRKIQEKLQQNLEKLKDRKTDFMKLEIQFEKEWDRVSCILQGNQDCLEKLNYLEQQIPKILLQQKKQIKQLLDLKAETDHKINLYQYNFNELIQEQIKLLTKELKKDEQNQDIQVHAIQTDRLEKELENQKFELEEKIKNSLQIQQFYILPNCF